MNQRISSRVVSWIGHSAEEGVAMGRGGDEAVLPVVELVRGSPWALCCLPSPVHPETPGAPGAPANSKTPPAPPDLPAPQRPWPGLDHLRPVGE
jgi:hypothetical protein